MSAVTKSLQCRSEQQYTSQMLRMHRFTTTLESKKHVVQDNWTAGGEAPLTPYHVQSQMRTCRRHRSGQVQANNQTLAGGGYEAHGCSLEQVPIRISLHCVIHPVNVTRTPRPTSCLFLCLSLSLSLAGTSMSLTVFTQDRNDTVHIGALSIQTGVRDCRLGHQCSARKGPRVGGTTEK